MGIAYQISSNNVRVIILILLVLFIFLGCNQYNQKKHDKVNLETIKSVEIKSKKEIIPLDTKLKNTVKLQIGEIIPDSTINGRLILRNEKSAYEFTWNDNLKLLDKERDTEIAYLFNSKLSQYLAVYHYPGDLKNQFSVFEIGYLDKNTLSKPSVKTKESIFKTESGIALGISFDSLILIKGKEYKQEIKAKNDTLIKYVLNDYLSSKFLKQNKMPSYFLECKIKNAKVENIKFGFDYP